MQPNLSALSSFLRGLLVLGVSTFFGALILPVTAGGTLPTDWAHWRTVLGVALTAAVVAELAYVRSHMSAFNASQQSSTPTAAPATAVVAAAVKPLAILAVMSLALLCSGCLKVQTAAQQGADFANAFLCVEHDWGKPVAVVAGDCFNAEVAAAEDAIADVEAIAEGVAIFAQQDVGKVQASFPYSGNAYIVGRVNSLRPLVVLTLRAYGAPAPAVSK